jgi:hypothetical protein
MLRHAAEAAMPNTDEILAGLTAIARSGFVVAIVWHALVAAALVAWLAGWRPTRNVARTLIAAPLVSASAFAFVFGNPFNGCVLVAGALALVAFAEGTKPVVRAHALGAWAGVAMLTYGWFYPHFLANPVDYLYASPVGLVPCPSLSIAIGFALLGGLGDRRWGGVLAGLGLLYGIHGVFRLGVVLDVGLLAGAIALGVASLARMPRLVSTPV